MKKDLKCISSLLIGFYSLFFLAGCGGKGTEMDLSIKAENDQDTNNNAVKPHIDFSEIPLFFIANKGQVNDKAKFYIKGSKYTLWLTNEGMVFDTVQKRKKAEPGRVDGEGEQIRRDVSSLVFVNANPKPKMIPVEETPLKVNYFIGNDRSKWHSEIPTSQAVLYKDLYQDINLKVYGIERQIEYDWIVKPGGDTGAIKFAYKTVKESRIDVEGNLLIETDSGKLMHKRPVAYQKIDAERVLVAAEYKYFGENSYGFAVDNYNDNYPLVIDPVVLPYSTYLGGGAIDRGHGIAADNNGNVYVTGETSSADFPTKNQYDGYKEEPGDVDIFVTKIDTARSGASSLVYSTYLGGSRGDWGHGIAADNNGNVYVTGYTYSDDFPTKNQYQEHLDGETDAFVSKIDTTRSGIPSLIYSTYLGGEDEEWGKGIALDNSGNVYVTGHTSSADFPILNQYQTCRGGERNVFVTKINVTQSGDLGLFYSTCLGGENDIGGIAADNRGNTYVTGSTFDSDFPTKNEYQEHQGNSDAFVSKIDTAESGTSSLIYSTFLGGGEHEWGNAIAADDRGNVYVTGQTSSTDFPTLNQYQKYLDGYDDAFVTKIDTTLSGISSLKYSTYLGGGNYEWSGGIAQDNSGNVYVTGTTSSTDFPIKHQCQRNQRYRDAFISKIDTNSSGAESLVYSTYLGGDFVDWGLGIAIDDSANAYVTGETGSDGFPTKNQYQATRGGWYDAFMAKLSFVNARPVDISVTLDGSGEGTVTSQPAGIDCPNDCTEEYEMNTSVTLTAVPAENSFFGGWSGGSCEGNAPCTKLLDDDLKVTATFSKKGVLSSWLMLLLK